MEELPWNLLHPSSPLAPRQSLQDPSEDRQGLATLFPLSSLATTVVTSMLVSAVAAAVATAAALGSLPECPEGWTHLDSSCFYTSDLVSTWSGGRAACQGYGGDLAR